MNTLDELDGGPHAPAPHNWRRLAREHGEMVALIREGLIGNNGEIGDRARALLARIEAP